MSFAAAAFLVGLLALGVPWWLHRREANRVEPRVVGSLMLMHASDDPIEARRTLQHRWLMALRMLLLAVLVLAFAQPMVHRALTPSASAATAPPRLIVVDTSASMAADPGSARRRAHELVADLPSGGRGAVIAAAADLTVAAPFTTDRQTLHDAVDALRPGPGHLGFDGLASRVWGLAGTLTEEPVDVHLISDFQRSAMPAQFNALLAGARGRIVLHPVAVEAGNWLIEDVTAHDAVRVSLRGIATPERSVDVTLSDAGGELARQQIVVPAGGRVNVEFPLPEAPRSDHWVRAAIDAGDVLSGDDAGFTVIRHRPAVPLPVFFSHQGAGQLDYLQAAVGAAAPRFQLADPSARGPVAVVLDPGRLAGDRMRLLTRHLESGGGVLLTMGPATERAGVLPLEGEGGEGNGVGTLGHVTLAAERARSVVSVDDAHPVLRHVPSWKGVAVSRYLTLEAGAGHHVLATLDDGTPLIVEQRLGTGRLLMVLTAFDPTWSTLVTRPAFVRLVADALAYLAEDSLPAEGVAGQDLLLPARNVQLFDLQGSRLLSLGDTVDRPVVRLADPGIYRLRTPSQSRLLAVNADLRESDLRVAGTELLERWQKGSLELAAPDAPSRAGSGRGTLPLSPWLLAVLCLLAAVEPVASNLARLPAWRRRGGAA